MFFFTGCCLGGGILLATYTKLFNSKDSEKNEENNPDILKIPYNYYEITDSMLNNEKDPKYIGHLFKSKKGSKKDYINL
jgi:hypothetical protein